MGENTNHPEQHSAADRLREEIRHTESDITDTVTELQQRLSPANIRRQGTRKATSLAWQFAAKLMEYAQRTSVQATFVGSTTALLLLLGNRSGKKPATRKAASRKPAASGISLGLTAAKAFYSSARQSVKRGTTRPGKGAALRALASSIGAGLGAYWFRRRHRA